jgi:hypothetical protein
MLIFRTLNGKTHSLPVALHILAEGLTGEFARPASADRRHEIPHEANSAHVELERGAEEAVLLENENGPAPFSVTGR